jgi:membrane fusion protein, copper/silver efflux system
MNKFKIIFTLIVVFMMGYWIGNPGGKIEHLHEEIVEETVWTCSMHPNVKLPEKGQCPICFMDLIPLTSNSSGEDGAVLELSKSAEKLAEIQTTKVKKEEAFAELNVIGKLDFDESRIKTISAWIGGRIERLYVDYTGIPVEKDNHLLEIYSPEVISAQEEFLTILKTSSEIGLKASLEKLLLLGVTPSQINQLKARKKVQKTLTVYSPISGIVIEKNAQEGEYITTGKELFKVVDFSKLWLVMDIFESDLPFVYLGQEVEFDVESYPGKTFSGEISFISPTIDPMTRSVKVRVNIDNSNLQFKPDMFVNAVIKSQLNINGDVIQNQYVGKWVCPMHPEEVYDHFTQCEICGMDVVKIDEINQIVGVNENSINENPLVIPVTSVLKTGSRSIVYVRNEKDNIHLFKMREVIIGPKVGANYIVLDGLEIGEEVVSHGAFKIDSEMQISAHPSMMNFSEKVEEEDKIPNLKKETIDLILIDYINFQENLANDDFKKSFNSFEKIYNHIDDWELDIQHLMDISKLRKVFHYLSDQIISNTNSIDRDNGLNVAFCPMAFDNTGASWVQKGDRINNPYFGASMLRCGEITEKIGLEND